ncbi:speriolin-like protein [Mixophyes fleayi]|uniref:speriolin-like protein n=1 Tax=Mixophyes fleayi TaxID=3061075 RepID=UPI003F4DDE08
MEVPQIHEKETLKVENIRLLSENAELRKMVGLMQENVELRNTLRNHEIRVRSLSPAGNHSNPTDQDIDKGDHHQSPPYKDANEPRRSQTMVGEIAFQLDRRILSAIFQQQSRLYGFLVSNVKEKINQVTTCPLTNKVDEKQRAELTQRYHEIMNRLKVLGYDKHTHPLLSEYLVNTYGIMKDRALLGTNELASYDNRETLRNMVTECTPKNMVKDVGILFKCLHYLSVEDGKPLFIW